MCIRDRENTEKGYFRTPGEDTYLSGPFSNEKLLMYQASTAGASHIQTNGCLLYTSIKSI